MVIGKPLQISPRENARLMTIAKEGLDGIEAHRLDGIDADIALAHLEHFLTRPMALDFGRGAVDTKKLKWQSGGVARENHLKGLGLRVDHDGLGWWCAHAAVEGRDVGGRGNCH